MPIKRPRLVNNEIYHIIIRGVGDSLIFKDTNDYYRGIFSLYEFNTSEPVEIIKKRRAKSFRKDRGELFSDTREPLVDILAFCFVPNHIHLLLRQINDNGISQFMRKFGAGYAGYFNKKYNRKGHLFQGRFQAIHILDNEQLRTIFVYIHTNPLSLIEPNWKKEGIKNFEKAIKFLEEEYRWSSYFDYIGKKNFPSVTNRKFMLKIMDGEESCRNFVKDWIKYKKALREE